MAFLHRAQSRSKAVRVQRPRSAQIDDYVGRQIAADGPGLALAIVADGTLVHAACYGLSDVRRGLPIEQDTIFHLASCGKQMTGLGILLLAEERKLQLDDPLGRHLPSLAGFGPRVTIRTLLHHTSGIRDLYDEDGVRQLLARNARPTNADLVRTYAELGCPIAQDASRPGDAFRYSNGGYDLLGAVIEAASGQSYHDFFASRVFERLKMADTFSVPDRRIDDPRRATGYMLDRRNEFVEAGDSELDNLVGSGSFYTTVSDLCRYEQALRTNILLSKASMEEAFTGGRTNDGSCTNYGFGWNLATRDGVSFADHEGDWNGFRCYIYYCLDRPLSMFALSNHPAVNLLELADVAADACR